MTNFVKKSLILKIYFKVVIISTFVQDAHLVNYM